MKTNDLIDKNENQLKEQLADLRAQERKLRFSISNNQQKNIRQLRQVKKNIARVLTQLTKLTSANKVN
jgi:ribosomal protein L29